MSGAKQMTPTVTERDSAAEQVDDPERVGELTRALRVMLRAGRCLDRLDSGLTAQQFRIMSLVADGGERSAKLAAKLAISKPTLTAVADGLVAAGYLSRQDEPGDRRVVRLALTDAGRDAYAHARQVLTGWFGRLVDTTDDPEALLRLLTQIDDALDRDRKPAGADSGEGGA
jgi:DNA-binding MarR family transcriptional regulator